MTITKKIVLVGNADVEIDYSEFVDAADIVVRFNLCRNYGRNTGRKTDVLCLSNTAGPARRLAKYKLIEKMPFIEEVKEIWFPRPLGLSLGHIYFKPPGPLLAKLDYSRDIVRQNALEEKSVVYFGKKIYRLACQELGITGNTSQPSSGYLAVKYLMDQGVDDVTLVGFSFAGWAGHLWEKEEQMIGRLIESGRITFLPTNFDNVSLRRIKLTQPTKQAA